MKQKNLTLDAFKKIYAEWQASDTTIREFCRTICFDEDKFYFWKKKLECLFCRFHTGEHEPAQR